MERFNFSLQKTGHFSSFYAFSKKYKLKGKFPDNLGLCICRLFHVLAQLPFTTRETELDYYYQKVNVRLKT